MTSVELDHVYASQLFNIMDILRPNLFAQQSLCSKLTHLKNHINNGAKSLPEISYIDGLFVDYEQVYVDE